MYKHFLSAITSPEGRLNSAGERRGSQRYPAPAPAAVLGWHEGPGFRTSAAVLVDVSMGGAAARTEAPPPHPSTVWVRLHGAAPTDWVEATTVSVRLVLWLLVLRRKVYLVRLRFTSPCPYAFFRGASQVASLGSGEHHRAGW
jgi:hypothetical protein